MSALSYLNGLIDNCIANASFLDGENKKNLQRISEFEAELGDANASAQDVVDTIAIGGWSDDILNDLKRDLEYHKNRVKNAKLSLIGANARKTADDETRLYWHARANGYRKARDKYKESL